MGQHRNAALTPSGRRLLVRRIQELGWTVASAARAAGVSQATAHKWLRRFRSEGVAGLADRSSRPHRTRQKNLPVGPELQEKVVALLHSPPSTHGLNRTSWRLTDLESVLAEKGIATSKRNISEVIREAGFRYRKARISLTSSDPDYREKVDRIKSTLSTLTDAEAFFSIDEFGPFAVKMKGGRALQPPNVIRSVPQWQSSKGSLIVTAALELRTNQITFFFSDKKNTRETVALIEQIRREYRGLDRIYLSWDAAPWHQSKSLNERISFLNEWAEHDGAPSIELRPLPSRSQFLNVIEAVFSGMARSILHNSDYPSASAARHAISAYIEERNAAFKTCPRRAGREIWGKEPELARFRESNLCKDPRYA